MAPGFEMGLSHSRGAIRWTARTLWPAKRGWRAEVFLSSQRVYGPPTVLASTAETVRACPPALRKTRETRDFLIPAGLSGGQRGQFARQSRRVVRKQPQRTS